MKITERTTSSLCFGAGFDCHPPCVKAPFPVWWGWLYTGDVPTVRTKGGFPAHPDLLSEETQAREQGGKSHRWLSPVHLMAWVKQLCLCHQMNPPLLRGGHGAGERAFPAAPLCRQIAWEQVHRHC